MYCRKRYQWVRDGYGEFPDISGSIVNGFSATQQFKQEIPQNGDIPRFIGNESYIAHTGAWLSAIAALSDIRSSVHTQLDNTENEQADIVAVSPNPCTDYIYITSKKQWKSCEVYSLIGEKILDFKQAIIPNVNYRFPLLLPDNQPITSGNYFLCFKGSVEQVCIPFSVSR